VDTASYDLFRRDAGQGLLPAAASVRLEEYVNYFSYAYPAPAADAAYPFQVSLAARNAGLTMPIIVVTAFGDDHLRAQVERLGSASLLSKPFRPEELLSLARSLLPS